jgi:hypothetical protein
MIVTVKRCLAALGIAAVAATAARAEQLGPKWQGWIGCWTPTAAGVSVAEPSANAMFVCITPAASGADAVDVTTIDGGKVLSTQRIDASGAERPLEAKGCTGTQKAWWSADERRIYLRSASTCEGLKSSTSAILSLTADGEWLDVRGVSSEGAENVRVARYRDAGIPSAAPAEIASALRERGQAAGTARIAAGAPVGTTAVIEATRAVDSAVVAAWILERDQKFSLDASTLVQLADAGVPGAVTDAMVAVSNPSAFHFARAEGGDVPVDSGVIVTDARMRRRVSIMSVPYDPWSWGYLGYPGSGYGYDYPYGYGYNSYGYGGYGYGGYYGGYAPPIIVVTPGSGAESRGRMVKGRGYTQTEGSPRSGTAHERPRSTSSPAPSASSPSPSASSSSGRSSSGSSSSGRTAKPRN